MGQLNLLLNLFRFSLFFSFSRALEALAFGYSPWALQFCATTPPTPSFFLNFVDWHFAVVAPLQGVITSSWSLRETHEIKADIFVEEDRMGTTPRRYIMSSIDTREQTFCFGTVKPFWQNVPYWEYRHVTWPNLLCVSPFHFPFGHVNSHSSNKL